VPRQHKPATISRDHHRAHHHHHHGHSHHHHHHHHHQQQQHPALAAVAPPLRPNLPPKPRRMVNPEDAFAFEIIDTDELPGGGADFALRAFDPPPPAHHAHAQTHAHGHGHAHHEDALQRGASSLRLKRCPQVSR
ncbi:Protein of unknown function, partial [Gryllus bimaculatus]